MSTSQGGHAITSNEVQIGTCIYALIDPRERDTVAAIRYIGKTMGSPVRRCRQHIAATRRGMRTHCYNWIRNLLGAGLVPGQRILETVLREDGAEAERRWIRSLREQGAPLTNLTDGGDGVLGHDPSPEARARMSAAHLGKKPSAETRAKLSAANIGKKLSPEHKAKIAVALRGRSPSDEARRKTSAALRGREFSAEHRAKIGTAKMGNKNFLGRRHSDESRAKMMGNKNALGHRHSEEARARMSAAHRICLATRAASSGS